MFTLPQAIASVIVAFAPADESVVGVDRHDDTRPVLVTRHECAQSLNLHCVPCPN